MIPRRRPLTLVACSCKGRGFCPSCGAKRAAVFAAFLGEEVLEQVAHAQWVFTVPKMIRPYFLHRRELLGKLCRAAYQTAQELMAAAAIGVAGFRTRMVAVVQTAGETLAVNPHVHALAPRGGWDAAGQFGALRRARRAGHHSRLDAEPGFLTSGPDRRMTRETLAEPCLARLHFGPGHGSAAEVAAL